MAKIIKTGQDGGDLDQVARRIRWEVLIDEWKRSKNKCCKCPNGRNGSHISNWLSAGNRVFQNRPPGPLNPQNEGIYYHTPQSSNCSDSVASLATFSQNGELT